MIRYVTGNLLEANTEALVNAVNCVGVMGKGIALQFKRTFSDNFEAYARACGAGQVQPGHMFTFETHLLSPKWIINFPTKRHWRDKSNLGDIESGLMALRDEVKTLRVRSIAMPALGCGNGGLPWGTVRELIEKAFAAVDVDALLFEPC